ncbi:hypothetical protein H0B56_07275 [Haloechinothrix sp. YIM 98757]|uniref:Uncharacterized protein n=1 Tax=Haloechinothrix aidingensis TaxID=2752311 RepID=A0A838A9H5_9PSEU|nr:hypothetical protein [Haloechinothrix aidingensis]MBA0125339.1 hypothetical protein [Haloechinothrix aidingensis]
MQDRSIPHPAVAARASREGANERADTLVIEQFDQWHNPVVHGPVSWCYSFAEYPEERAA